MTKMVIRTHSSAVMRLLSEIKPELVGKRPFSVTMPLDRPRRSQQTQPAAAQGVNNFCSGWSAKALVRRPA